MNKYIIKKQKIISFIYKILQPFKLLILAQLIIAIAWGIHLSLKPYILKIIIDKIPNLNEDKAIAELFVPMIAYLGLSLFIVVIFRFYDFIWLKINPQLKSSIAVNLVKKMLGHSITLFHNNLTGDLTNKIKDVMTGVPDLLKLFIDGFVGHFFALIVAIFTVWTVNYKFSLLLCIWIMIFIFGVKFFYNRAENLCIQAAQKRSSVIGQVVDIFSNIINIYLFSAKSNELKNLTSHLNHYVVAEQKRDWWFLFMSAFQGVSFVIYQSSIFILLVYDFKNSRITAGDLTLLISVNIVIINCLSSLSMDILTFSEIFGNIRQGLQIVLQPIDIQDIPYAKPLIVNKGKIIFENIKFSYPNLPALFQNKSVVIGSGEKVGLVGYSGSGKSTFINLILRLYEVNQGRILIDDQDIRSVNQDSLRNNITMLYQDPSLFHRSVIDNIRYGKPNSSEKEIISAAIKAHAHDFIIKLPQGYNTILGEKGVKLSGGQRQRIAIARAILKNAPILILDEATSQLDVLTEEKIQASLSSLMENKTVIVIAHRLSTLLKMDRIIVFDNGKIIKSGKHNELLQEPGLYKMLWNAQVGGFLLDNDN